MSAITKVSEIDASVMAKYLRLNMPLDQDDSDMLTSMIGVAKDYIKSYTGQAESALDNFQDFVIVVYILVQDMWDNRALYVDKANLNNTVTTILGLHRVNLLPTAEISND